MNCVPLLSCVVVCPEFQTGAACAGTACSARVRSASVALSSMLQPTSGLYLWTTSGFRVRSYVNTLVHPAGRGKCASTSKNAVKVLAQLSRSR